MQGKIITQIKCDTCYQEWFGCTDTKVNLKQARAWAQANNGFTRRRVNGRYVDLCAQCSENLETQQLDEGKQ